jgi:predicted lipoprotein with Yx(FWY)xxD motif
MRRSVAFLTLVAALTVAATASALAARTLVALRSTSIGQVLVGPNGHTLYMFGADRTNRSTCYGACAQAWPPLLAVGAPAAGGGVKANLLGTTKRTNGKLQVTYAGHPLYYFSEDTTAGSTKGEGLHAFGAGWWALAASGAKIVKPAGSTTTTTSGYP